MSFDVQERVAVNRKRLTRNAIRTAAGITTLVVAAGLMTHTRHQRSGDATSHAPVVPGPFAPIGQGGGTVQPALGPGRPSEGSGFVAPARRVVLPAGAAHVDGYPVRFPHTPEGAAALALAMCRGMATLDYPTADHVARLYMDPAFDKETSALAANLVRGEREQIGAPVSGPVPIGYGVSSADYGVMWRQVTTDVYDVTAIGYTDTNGKDGHLRQIVAGVTRVKWFPDSGSNGGDWKAQPATGGVRPKGLGEIGSKAFNDNGYAEIEEAQP